jgi:DNA-binding winged helix-turn-helix (wHTH) protein
MSGKHTRWRLADLVLDTRRQRVWRGAQEIRLPKLSYGLLAALVRRSAEVASDDELMQAVWPGLIVSPETVSQRVKLLREALNDDSRMPRYIGRFRGRGYYLVCEAIPLDDDARAIPTPAAPEPPLLQPIAELTLLEGPKDAPGLREPDWASPPAIPAQFFAGLLATPAADDEEE